jgi:hypothetical protein
MAARAWALEHPHEYALIYGSPVPGYQAPQDTVAQAGRVPLALLAILSDGWFAKRLLPPERNTRPSPTLAAQLAHVAAITTPGLPEWVMARALIAWSQLFGMISFELFGQFVGSVSPADEFFEHAAGLMASFVGLPD